METELILLKYILYNNIYNNYYKYINKNYIKDNNKELYKLYLTIEVMFKENPDKDFTLDEFELTFYSMYPAASRPVYTVIFNKLREINIDLDVIVSVLEEHKRKAIAHRVSEVAFDVAQGIKTVEDLLSEVDQLNHTKIEEDDYQFVTCDLHTLLDELINVPGIKFRLKTLRKMYGSLRKGDFGFLFTRPEVGKTTLLASEATYMSQQLEQPVIHFSNEESGNKIQFRYIQAAFGKTRHDIEQNLNAVNAQYQKHFAERIKILDSASISRRDVEKVIERINPGLIIIDSIDKLKGFKDDRDDLVYKEIYQWGRELAKTYAPVIGVCHASASAENKKYLNMDDVAYAKTAKQGEADWILGIGATDRLEEQNMRYLAAPKNKLIGDDESMEEFRHGHCAVTIRPEIARYEDVMKWD